MVDPADCARRFDTLERNHAEMRDWVIEQRVISRGVKNALKDIRDLLDLGGKEIGNQRIAVAVLGNNVKAMIVAATIIAGILGGVLGTLLTRALGGGG